MADNNVNVSELPKVESISDGAMFAIEQNGKAYHATAAQVRNLIPGSGGGDSGGTGDLTGAVRYDMAQDLLETEKTQGRENLDAVSNVAHNLVVENVQILQESVAELQESMGSGGNVLVLDLTGLELDSGSDTPTEAQLYQNLSIDTAAVMAHNGLVAIDYTDVRFSAGPQRVYMTSSKSNPDGTGAGSPVYTLYALAVNPWSEYPSAFKLGILDDGTAFLSYRPKADPENTSGGSSEESRVTILDMTNMTEDFNGGSVKYTYEDGSTQTFTQGTDSEGNYTLTSGDYTLTLKGMS